MILRGCGYLSNIAGRSYLCLTKASHPQLSTITQVGNCRCPPGPPLAWAYWNPLPDRNALGEVARIIRIDPSLQRRLKRRNLDNHSLHERSSCLH